MKDPLLPAPEHEIDCTERYAELLQSFATIYTQSPRANRQLDVVFYTGFGGLSNEEIARNLGVELPKVYELRSRGVKLLRQSADFSLKLQDFVANCL
jgi:DNA-directed RNA polymerase specialized sigma24 family protein